MFKLQGNKDIGESKNFITIYKNKGKFYNAYNNDAYIINLIFGYKVLPNQKFGFPDNALDKVLDKLDDYKISYQIIYSDQKPLFKDYKKLNKYLIYYKKSLEKIDKQNKVD